MDITNSWNWIAPPILALVVGTAAHARSLDAGSATRAEPDLAPLRQALDEESAALAARLSSPLTLADCIDLALERNIALAVGVDARESAHVLAGGSVGEFFPTLEMVGSKLRIESLDGSYERLESAEARIVQRLPLGTRVEAGVRFDDSDRDAQPREGVPSLRVTQPLLRGGGWGRTTSGVRDARLAASGQDAELRRQTLQVVFQVEAAYLEVLRRRQLVEVNRRAVERDRELVDFSEAKLAAQLATQRDVLSAEIILAQDQGRLVNAAASHRAALDDLGNVLGLRIGRDLQLVADSLAVEPIALDEAAWRDQARRDNPELERLRLECERALLAADVAGNERLPQLDVAVAYTQRRAPWASDPLERAWEGAVTASYPFPNRQQASAYTAARIDVRRSRRLLLDAERALDLAVRDVARNLGRSAERLDILAKNIEGARSKVEFARVNFQLGRASNLDITDAQKDLLEAETDRVNELVFYRLELARLEQLLGRSSHDDSQPHIPSPR